MNAFAPQSIQTVVELQYIADVRRQIINPGSSKPIIGCVQDTIVSSFLLTSKKTQLDGKQAMNIIMYTNLGFDKFKQLDKNKVYTGQEIYSMIIPPKINVQYKKDGKTTLKISNSKLEPGSQITKEQLGTSRNSLIHHVWDQHKHIHTKHFIDNTRRLAISWITQHGFSVGMKDIIIDPKLRKQFETLIESKRIQANHLITEMENNPVLRDIEAFETSIRAELNVLRDNVIKLIMNNIDEKNSFYVMISSQSKGSSLNMGQMSGCVGQQDIEGKRIQKKLNGRTLPHYHKDDDGILARGFVESCFLHGLSPQEFFFHTMSGRQGLIDTAIKSVTGDTPIIILEDSEAKYINIGDWIDKQLKDDPSSVKHYKDRDMELLDLHNHVYIPTTNGKGNVTWSRVTAVTRHDPGLELYEIKTHGGKSVIVTESKSLLIWNEKIKEFEQKSTPLVKIGDYVPVTMKLDRPPIIKESINKLEDAILAPNNVIRELLNNMTLDESQRTKDIIGILHARLGISDQTNTFNDVVLDKIVQINKIDVKKYPKVYDLTVPDTTNFCLANGLHVVDTAETGYIQRKLVKALEDFMIKYDGTVRNARDVIIQCVYGDAGYNPTYQSEQKINLIMLNNKDIKEKYTFNKDERKEFGFSEEKNNKLYEKLIKLRDILRTTQLRSIRNYSLLRDGYMMPVNFSRLVETIKNDNELGKKKESVDADYIMNTLKKVLDHENTPIMKMTDAQAKDKNSYKYKDEKLVKIAFEAALYDYFSPKKILVDYGFNKAQFDELIRELVYRFKESIAEPGEMVGTLAAQSIGEPATQLTLNSVDACERLIIKKNDGSVIRNTIGTIVDNLLNKHKKKIEYIKKGDQSYLDINDYNYKIMSIEYIKKGDQSYLDINDYNYKIMSIDENSNTDWYKIEAVTRHLPINEDGSNTLVKIKTQMGREMTGTRAKSFLIYRDDKVVPIEGKDLKVGMRVPIVYSLPFYEHMCQQYLDMTKYFPKTEYVYGTEMEKARQVRTKGTKKRWYKKNNGKLFTLPYVRSDVAGVAMDDKINTVKGVKCKSKQEYKQGCIYPLKCIRVTSKFPEKMKLDEDFGFFIGAYLAEGCVTDTYVSIANNDKTYRERIKKFSDKYKIGTHEQTQKDKNKKGWTSIDIRLHSVLMARFVKKTCGHLSHNKVVPNWVFNAPTKFVKELINGYYSGDGCIGKPLTSIDSGSVSKRLTYGIQTLLYRFNILGRITITQQKKNNRGTEVILPMYTLSIRNKSAFKFANEFKLTLNKKQQLLDKLMKKKLIYKYGWKNVIEHNGELMMRDKLLPKLIELHKNKDKKFDKLYEKYNNPVYYDSIISIKPVESSHRYVYDLTIKDTKTFVLEGGISCFDTFHFSGISEKGVGTLGVPRLREIMSLARNPKTPRTIMHVQKEYYTDKVMCSKIASYIKYTVVEDVTDKIEIFYDPHPLKKDSIMHRDGVDNPYVTLTSTKASCQTDVKGLPWLIRLMLNREKMLDKEVTLLDIKTKFCEYWGARYTDTKGMKKEDKLLMERITKCAILSNYDNSDIPIIHIRLDMNNYDKKTLMNFKDIVLTRFKLKGIDGITNVKDLSFEPHIEFTEDGSVDKKNRYVIYADGTNLGDIRYIRGLDLNRTYTNNVVEIFKYFGIEAARSALIKEYKTVLEANGSGTNYQHWSILVDAMTSSNTMISVDRHGMSRLDNDPLPRASFEKTVEQFTLASVFRENDSMQSVSARIMTGQAIKGGTGLCHLIMNTKLLENTELPNTSDEWKRGAGYKRVSSDKIIDDILKKKSDENAFMPEV
jgi:DNA-directed RNA polymerase beta' subunit